MQIEQANIVDLDWALAHMDAVKSKKTRQKMGAAEDWVYEAEMKDSIEDVRAMLHYSPNLMLMPPWRRILKVLEPYFWTTVRLVSVSRVLNIPIPFTFQMCRRYQKIAYQRSSRVAESNIVIAMTTYWSPTP